MVDGDIDAILKQAGIRPDIADAVMQIDELLQHWRRRSAKRELGIRALEDLKSDLDLLQFDVLVAIRGPQTRTCEAGSETMVATVAERLNIDPSRASRLVSDIVDRGYAKRAVSQADARRTIIELTDKGRDLVDAVRSYKFLVMGDYLSSWSSDELRVFVPLLQKFANWHESIEPTASKFAADIADIAKSLESRHKR